jgi:amicyanin
VSAASSRRSSIAVVAALGLLLALAGLALTGTAPVRAGGDHLVEIVDFDYAPREITISVGDTVTWTNLDAVAHTATSTTGAFDSGDLEQGESWSLTFTSPGTYEYLCTPHPSMTGRIVVEAAAAPMPTSTPGAAPSPTPAPGASLPDVRMEEPRADWMTPAGIGLLGLALLLGPAGSARRALRRRRT